LVEYANIEDYNIVSTSCYFITTSRDTRATTRVARRILIS